MENHTRCHWTPENVQEMAAAVTLEAASKVVIKVARQMRKLGKVIFICAPITTGGTGDSATNRSALYTAIKKTRDRGFMVFDQESIEEDISRLAYGAPSTVIVTEFYKPLLESGAIDELWYLDGSHESEGASLEIQLFTAKFGSDALHCFSDDLFKPKADAQQHAVAAEAQRQELAGIRAA